MFVFLSVLQHETDHQICLQITVTDTNKVIMAEKMNKSRTERRTEDLQEALSCTGVIRV